MTDIASATDPILSAYLRPCLATLHVPAPSDTPDAAERLDVELRNAEADLRDQGVEGEPLERAIAEIRRAGHGWGRSIVAVVREDGVDVWPTSAELPALSRPGPLPALAPLLAARQRWVPHALVLLDRIGADLLLVQDRGESEDVVVDGSELHITKSNPGGWSQRRFQQRAEERWQDNAQAVADRLGRELRGTPIHLVLLAGDQTARSVLLDLLPDEIRGMVVELDTGGRAEDGSAEDLAEAVDAAVRKAAGASRAEAVEAVQAAVGQGAGAVGRADVLEALFESRVDTLLVAPGAAHDVTAHIGPEPAQVAADSGQLHDLGLDAARVPLVDAALRGAAATGAHVVVLPDEMAPHDPLDPDPGDTPEVQAAAEIVVDGLAATLRG